MKLLHREAFWKRDMIYRILDYVPMLNTEIQELRFGGEWILAEDETLVADGMSNATFTWWSQGSGNYKNQ